MVLGGQSCSALATVYTSRAAQLFFSQTIFMTFHSAGVSGSSLFPTMSDLPKSELSHLTITNANV